MRHILILSTLLSVGYGANILGVFHYPSESHDVLGSILLGNLAKRGHNVTYISPFRTKATYPNFTHIVIEEMIAYKEEHVQQYMREDTSFLDNFKRMKVIFQFNDFFLSNEKIQRLLNSDSQFDLIIIFAGFDAALGFAHHYDAPVMLFIPFSGFCLVDGVFGNPSPPSYVPNVFVSYSDEMTFLQRAINTFSGFILNNLVPVFSYFAQDSIEKFFPGSPSVSELLKSKVAMALINTHLSTETPRPYVPAMVQIGGFHLQDPEPLPEDLKKVLDESSAGVIYFSFGTNVKISDIAEDKVDILMNTLGQLPHKVLMKSEIPDIRNKPPNVEIRTWYPQRGILAHPNVKLFISHGGYGGCTESLYYGVPMICIPFFSDQPKNCADVEHDGYGVHLPMPELSKETFKRALDKVLYNEKLLATAKLKSELYRDQEMNPMNRAAYWVDHVIKHKGAKHLRVKALDLAWYQYYLLDVIAFIVMVLLVITVISCYILKYCFCKICKRQQKIKTN